MVRRTLKLVAGAVLLLALSACEPTTSPPTQNDVLPPPDPIESSTSSSAPSTVPPSSDTTSVLRSNRYEGFLPDETPYAVTIESLIGDEVEGISGGIVMDVDGTPNAVGIATFLPGESQGGVSYEGGVLRLAAGRSTEIEFYDHILAELPANPETLLATSIRGATRDGFPVIRLSPPFRWADDDELPLSMQVQYQHFVVRRGCGELAVACSETRAIQVIPIDTQSLPLEAWDELEVFVESSAARPISDRFYLDPGPLSERVSADLMWTGDELIVWGGKTFRDGVPDITDGAAFDPATGEWRMLPPFPDSSSSIPNRGIWAGSEMIVVGSSGTYSYDPQKDIWRPVAEARFAPEFHDRMLYDNGKVYIWRVAGVIDVLDVKAGFWTEIEAPHTEITPMAWSGVLRGDVNGRLIAITISEDRLCFGKQFWQLVGDQWQALPDVSLATPEYSDCSAANQSASVSNDLVVWDEEGHPAALYSTLHNDWSELPGIPLGGAEGPSGPVPMDDDHFMVPRWGEGAIFDANSDESSAERETWTRVDLPGQGTDAEIVWTGSEFLAWGIWGSFDAWRWAPEDYVFGTGSTTR